MTLHEYVRHISSHALPVEWQMDEVYMYRYRKETNE